MRRLPSSLTRAGLFAVALALTAGLLTQLPLVARSVVRTLSAQATPSVHGTPVAPRSRPADLTQGAGTNRPRPVTWPAGDGGGAVTLAMKATPDTATVTVLDRAVVPAGWRNGVVLAVRRTDHGTDTAAANLTVDYSRFTGAFGADWAARLRLLALPACALTTPTAAGCAATPVASRNDPATATVSADVRVAPAGTTMFALAAGASGSTGSFTVSSLTASSTWTAGGNSGNFSWNYPLAVPPSLGGPAPQIGLSYSSAAVDGRTEVTNNQPSWIGEGFDYWPGFIERTYIPCADDMGSGANNTTDTGDNCWGTDNAVMSLSGSGGELIKDGATGTWHLKDDDASKVEHLTNTVNPDNDHEYWKVTSSDGTQYFFGLNRLPGYTGTAPADKVTNAVFTEPVAGNQAGEPCHATSFASSFCTQAWRWNLDYVVDVHGNTMSLFYHQETNEYARNLTDTDNVSYVRGGVLDHIDYGTNNRSGTDTENTSTAAPMRVLFTAGDRCLSSCSTHDAAHWPDTPWDQSCTGSSCPGLYSPTFWTTSRLASVATKVWNAATSQYKDVDTWTLTQNFPDPGDGSRAGMWLDSIVHTGVATGASVTGGPVAMPAVNFDWLQLTNRVDTATDGKLPMNWMRMATIWTDTGAKIDVRYTAPECVAGSHMPASPQNNTLRCYPVREEQADKSIKTEYFHKYLVTSVTQADLTGGSPDVVTSYSYMDTPAWRHTDDDGMTPDNLRTWSDFRGYGQVNTLVGDSGSGQQTLSESTYFRGMNGDLDGSGGTRSVSLPALDLNGDGDTTDTADARSVPDENAYSGLVRQTTTFNGIESAPVATTVSEPWQSAPTATRNMGSTTVYARFSGTLTAWSGTKLAAGGWRVTRSDTSHDTYGMVNQTDDQGDVAVGGDESCTIVTFARNTATNLLSPTARIEVHALRCSATPTSENDIVSDTRISFDQHAYGATPSAGDPTKQEVAKAWTASNGPQWMTKATTTYDAYGRVTDSSDVRGNHTTVAFTPATGGPVTAMSTTTPLGTTTATLEPSWGSTVADVDVNGRRTEETFDALGHVAAVWRANHTKAANPTEPSTTYTYTIRNSAGPNAVTTRTLNAGGSYTTTYALFDGLLRPRQQQSVSLASGHVGTVFLDTTYDAAGRMAAQSKYFDATVSPSTTLFAVLPGQATSRTVYTYDRAGRNTAVSLNSAGTQLWQATATYGGDRVSIVPPPGGTAKTTLSDAHGRTVELRQYHSPADVGSNTRSTYDVATFHFNRKGQPDSRVDNAGNSWTSTFDLLGRVTASHDPDRGDQTATYDDAGDLLTLTDARGPATALAYHYDTLGRRDGEYTPTTSGTKLASWTYDPAGAKGQLASSSRFVGADEYKVTARGYTPLYQATGADYAIPASQTGLAGTYTFGQTYTVDGQLATITDPNVGGLGAETLTFTYDPATGQPEQLKTNSPGLGQYVTNTDYTAFGEVSFVQYQLTGGNWLQRSFSYDDATRRLKQATTIRQLAPQPVDDTQYTYNQAGDVTRVAETQASMPIDVSCFGYDYARRLTDAWTPASGDCTQPKSVGSLGGPAPYWESWTFDAVGDRTSQTTHAAGGNTTASYSFPATCGNSGPHQVASVTTTGPAGNRTDTYCYDPIGDTASRPGPAGSQTLTWSPDGNLDKDSAGGADTTYIYTADGTRLLTTDPSGTTLFLPGHEIRRTKATGAITATRYYTWAGQTCASVVTGGTPTWLVGDAQGTAQVAVASGTQAITGRRQDPYGNARGTAVSWPNNKGFVGGDVEQSTGLTRIGAREYDAALGRFLSLDPMLTPNDPRTWTGYAYAENSPVTRSDPSGLSSTSGSADDSRPDWGPGFGPNKNGYLLIADGVPWVITTHPIWCVATGPCDRFKVQYEVRLMGLAVSCSNVAGGHGLCYLGSDNFFHDLYGHASRPRSDGTPSSNPSHGGDPTPIARTVLPPPAPPPPVKSPASCITEFISNPNPGVYTGPRPGDHFEPAPDSCTSFLCGLGDKLGQVGELLGKVPGALCPECSLTSTILGYASAGAYAFGGSPRQAGAQVVSTTVGLVGGEAFSRLDAAGWAGPQPELVGDVADFYGDYVGSYVGDSLSDSG